MRAGPEIDGAPRDEAAELVSVLAVELVDVQDDPKGQVAGQDGRGWPADKLRANRAS